MGASEGNGSEEGGVEMQWVMQSKQLGCDLQEPVFLSGRAISLVLCLVLVLTLVFLHSSRGCTLE